MRVFTASLVGTLALAAAPASAQNLGTFRWHLQPYGSVLELTVEQKGNLFVLQGQEIQCGNNPSLPVTGLAVPQANGQIVFGTTTITVNGRGLHTRATISLSNGLNGTWSDNAGNTNQSFRFNPGTTCPGGPRTDPITP